jgi:hypothetical protein
MNAVIRVEATDNLPQVLIDRDMIARVVLNLVDNALKYSPPGALVTLRAEVVPSDSIPGGSRQEQMVRVRIFDTGPGVPLEYRESIFDRYSQIPGQKGRRASAGLGLAFCRLAIESHHGKIWVDTNTEAQTGSVFNFTLPLARAQTPVEQRPATPAAAAPPAVETPAAPPEPAADVEDPLKTRTDLKLGELLKNRPAPTPQPDTTDTDSPETKPAIPLKEVRKAAEADQPAEDGEEEKAKNNGKSQKKS